MTTRDDELSREAYRAWVAAEIAATVEREHVDEDDGDDLAGC
jgi:hypothetical protein